MFLSMKSKPVTLRAQVSPDIDFLVRSIAPLKNSSKDWTISDVVTEALREWLEKPENKEIIERHNLRLALENKQNN
jgi:hypothetical protein